MGRDAAHRDRLAGIRAALGQGDIQAGRRDLGVVEEQFEEITHPVEQQGVAGLVLEAAILGHHRCRCVRPRHESDYPRSSFPRKRESRFSVDAIRKHSGTPAFAGVTEWAKAPHQGAGMSESNVKYTEAEALEFHARGRPGKIEIVATKPMATQRDLALAYSPGVAVPVRAIAEDPGCAYDFTAKGNLVAVISNGTAILGLGNLGALASKPVMEGKAVLFKRFADVD